MAWTGQKKKLYVVLLLLVVYVNLIWCNPNNGTVQIREKSKSPLAKPLIGSKPVNIDSPEFARLVLRCVPEEVWSVVKSCEEETTSMLNTSKPTATAIGSFREHSIDGLKDSESDELHDEEDEIKKVVGDCILKKTDAVDEVTGQFDMDTYAKAFENTLLTLEQKSSAVVSFKSCVTANLIEPSALIFIRWNGSANKTKADANGNFISPCHVLRCDVTSLIQNGCSDASMSNSTLAWVLHEIQIG